MARARMEPFVCFGLAVLSVATALPAFPAGARRLLPESELVDGLPAWSTAVWCQP